MSRATLQAAAREQLVKIRDLVNDPIVGPRISRDSQRFLDLCAALDAALDSQRGLESFPPPVGTDSAALGHLYLAIYGVLNACYVQVTTIEKIAKGVQIKVERPEKTLRVLRYRNLVAAHPADNNFGVSAFLVQKDLTTESFTLVEERHDPATELGLACTTHRIRTDDLLAMQADGVREMASMVVGHIREQALVARERWLGGRPEALGHQLRQLAGADSSSGETSADSWDLGLAPTPIEVLRRFRSLVGPDLEQSDFRSLKETLDEFESAALEQGLKREQWCELYDLFKLLDADHRTEPGMSHRHP